MGTRPLTDGEVNLVHNMFGYDFNTSGNLIKFGVTVTVHFTDPLEGLATLSCLFSFAKQAALSGEESAGFGKMRNQ